MRKPSLRKSNDSLYSRGFKWYIVDRNDWSYYLHTDGVWRDSTYYNDLASGYFQTRKLAREAVRNAKRFEILLASPVTI